MPEVKSRLLVPAEMEDWLSPDIFSVPEVAVKFKAPVVWVSPLEAVNVPAEVTVPVPVVEILPVVDNVPFSLIDNAVTPPDLMAKEVLAAPPSVSLITKASPVPALVKLNEVWVVKPDDNVKAISRPSVVSMVLPPV